MDQISKPETPHPRSGAPLALQRAGANAKSQIKVSSPVIHGTISKMQSEYGEGVSPELWWEGVEGAKSYALILEDPDARSPTPFVHWVAYNIPADRTSLPEGMQEQERLTDPDGLLQGRTSKGGVGYFGPRPPVGDPPHHYHFQVFALDSELAVPPGAERDEVLEAMSGHVLGAGELVGTYQQTVEPPPPVKRNGSDVLIDCLMAWGVDTIFGLPGDGINGVMEAIRKRNGEIRFVQVRHEESAALMACAHSKWTGRIGCCLATTGPGGVHLLNGLYDAKFDRASVVAITGLPYHDLIDTFTQQDVDLPKLFSDVAAYSTRIMSAAHVENAVTLACRIACAQHTVTHVAIPTDVQEEALEDSERSMRNVQHHVSFAHQESERMPEEPELARAIEILNRGKRVAILAGHGALHARDELIEVAELLGAPIVKALLGKAAVPDDHPLCIGGIGLLGTRPSQEAFEECDTLLIVGSTFPYIEYYPKPGQARGVQIDRDASRIGLRFPAEVGLVGDARKTLAVLAKRLKAHADRSFLERCQRRKQEWQALLETSAQNATGRLPPGKLAQELGQRLEDDALVSWDSGHNTGVLARYVQARGNQQFAGSGMLATMACSIPYAIAAALAFPGRQVVAFTGDGGLSMLLGELATIVRYQLPIKIVVMKNNSLGQIKWEQLMFLGNREYECDLTPIDFVKAAEAFGIAGFRTDSPDTCGAALGSALAHPGPALVEATVDPYEPLLPAKRIEKYAKNLEKALDEGTRDAEEIRAALAREPSRTQLSDGSPPVREAASASGR